MDTDLRSWELRRPDLLLAELAATLPFDHPRTLLVRVDGAYDAQRLTSATQLWVEPPLDEHQRTRATERALRRLGLTWSRAPYRDLPLVVPVVVRPGPAWFSSDEQEVLLGLRYGSNEVSVRQGGPLTVTARGWYDALDEVWGTWPRARWAAAT